MMMIKMKMAITRPIFKPGPPNIRSKQYKKVELVYDDDNDNDDKKDENDKMAITQSIFELQPPDFSW